MGKSSFSVVRVNLTAERKGRSVLSHKMFFSAYLANFAVNLKPDSSMQLLNGRPSELSRLAYNKRNERRQGTLGESKLVDKFKRRTYHSLKDLLADIRYILAHRSSLRKAGRGGLVSYAFRERLMLVVTEVNGCRYCSYFHAQEALKAGITKEELKDLLDGCIPEGSPEEEIPALLYAQHWAESDTHLEPEAQRRLLEVYGEEKADAIQIILRMIRMGNLLGNSGVYLLYRLSFGRWGLLPEERGRATPATGS
jgi:AhpD family alkylhydroperoxidase